MYFIKIGDKHALPKKGAFDRPYSKTKRNKINSETRAISVALKVMLLRRFATTIRDGATQPCNIVSNGYNIVPTLQICVALKIVVANRLV